MKYIRTYASMSQCGLYRYTLWRVWDESKPACVFVGLNPSTADASEDDATIRRCVRFAKDWDCGELLMLNLFAFRATRPKDMLAACDPVGEENNSSIGS